MTEDGLLTEEEARAQGYGHVRTLPSGEVAGLFPFMFTVGLCVGFNAFGYRTRFCFESEAEALAALEAWDGTGFPPGWWIKQKPQDVNNPARGEPEYD